MTPDESQAKREAWVMDYLYGELNEMQQKSFEQALEHDSQLRALYEQQRDFDVLLPRGSVPEISDTRLQGVRWSSLRAVKQGPKPSLRSRLTRLWEMNMSIGWQVAAMAAMFCIGFLVNNETSTSMGSNDEDLAAHNIVDVRLDSVDVALGEVALTVSKQSTAKVKGNIENTQVRALLTQSLNRNANDDVRLQLTEFFAEYVEFKDVQTALIYTLKTDPNPGVRYNAVANLVKTPNESNVREALMYALVHDVNPGIRVEAFLALSQRVDATLQEILATYGVNDANTFIRERSKRLLQKVPKEETLPTKLKSTKLKSTKESVSI